MLMQLLRDWISVSDQDAVSEQYNLDLYKAFKKV